MPSLARPVFLLLLLFLLTGGSHAVAFPPTLTLNEQSSIRLGSNLEYFLEMDGPLALQVAAQQPDDSWHPAPDGYMVLGLTEKAYWFRFSVVSQTAKPWLLSLRYLFNSDAEIYLWPRAASAGDATQEKLPAIDQAQLIGSASWWTQRHYSLALPLVPGQVYDVYMRVSVPGPDKFAFVIEDRGANRQFEIWDNRWVGLFYGGFITMLLYNLFLAISTRSFTYGYYLLYMVSMLCYLMMMDGVLQAELSRYYIAICAVAAFGCQFCRHFLRTSTTLPGPDRFIKGVIASAIVLGLLLVVAGPRFLLTSLVMVLVAGYGFLLGCVGLLSRKRGNHVAQFFLLAWVFPLIGMFYTDLMYLGLVPFSDAGYAAMNIATLLEAILLSMALADRINVLRVSRQKTIVEAKQKLEMSNRALEKANRLKDGFLGTISHELRTPMNGIIGTLDLLKISPMNQHQQECLATIESSSVHMLAMVERILLFSELQSGSVRLAPATLDVQAWSRGLQERWAPQFAAKGLTFRLQVDASCSHWVSLDVRKLDCLITELLSNACKFTPQGDVWIEVKQRGAGSSVQWVLDVGDSGVGIPEEQLQRISESFRQGQSTYNRQYGGLGIGMAICKEIIAALQGEWQVESTPGKGTCIRVVIPVAHATPVSATPSPVSAPKASASKAAASSAANVVLGNIVAPAILVVEDNTVNQMVMKKILESLGWTCCIANNGLEAVDKAREKRFALILMDCQMPEMDGFAATEAIRAGNNPNQATPIVAVTANATDQDREHCMDSGMNDYLKKPVKPKDIGDIIARYVPAGMVDAVS